MSIDNLNQNRPLSKSGRFFVSQCVEAANEDDGGAYGRRFSLPVVRALPEGWPRRVGQSRV